VIVALHVVLDIVADLGQLFGSGMGKIARKPVIEVQTVPVRDSNGYYKAVYSDRAECGLRNESRRNLTLLRLQIPRCIMYQWATSEL
jgi:hypothetical protein